jgi:hypothetical protein
MANYWPTEMAVTNDTLIAERMNAYSKIVFSRTLKKAQWNNTKLIGNNVEEKGLHLKQQPGSRIFKSGNALLCYQ